MDHDGIIKTHNHTYMNNIGNNSCLQDDFALVRAEKDQLEAAKTKLETDLAEATKKVETVEQELIKEHWIYIMSIFI